MIKNFFQVDDGVYRGSAPSPRDVLDLKKHLNVNTIISLDKDAAQKIKRSCQLIGINHIIIPIDIHDKNSIKHLFKYDIEKLFNDKSVFVHCHRGKDRSGLLIALYRCLNGWDCQDAVKEAKELGFGTGIQISSEKFYTKLIHQMCPNHSHHSQNEDFNAANDIVSNVSQEQGQFRDYTLDRFEQQSWSPFEDYSVREWPFTPVDKYDYDEQYPNRENYGLPGDIFDIHISENTLPQVGQYDQNTQGLNGAGPSMIGGGFV